MDSSNFDLDQLFYQPPKSQSNNNDLDFWLTALPQDSGNITIPTSALNSLFPDIDVNHFLNDSNSKSNLPISVENGKRVKEKVVERLGPLEKRKRNTIASQKFRANKKSKDHELKQENDELKTRIRDLESKIKEQEMENKFLRDIILEKKSSVVRVGAL